MSQKRNKKLIRKIALRLKELREEHNLTQEELYNDTGINIGRIERGIIDPGIGTIDRICQYFKIELKDFFEF